MTSASRSSLVCPPAACPALAHLCAWEGRDLYQKLTIFSLTPHTELTMSFASLSVGNKGLASVAKSQVCIELRRMLPFTIMLQLSGLCGMKGCRQTYRSRAADPAADLPRGRAIARDLQLSSGTASREEYSSCWGTDASQTPEIDVSASTAVAPQGSQSKHCALRGPSLACRSQGTGSMRAVAWFHRSRLQPISNLEPRARVWIRWPFRVPTSVYRRARRAQRLRKHCCRTSMSF